MQWTEPTINESYMTHAFPYKKSYCCTLSWTMIIFWKILQVVGINMGKVQPTNL